MKILIFKRRRPAGTQDYLKGYMESFNEWMGNNRFELEAFLTRETGRHRKWIIEYDNGEVVSKEFDQPLTKRQVINRVNNNRQSLESEVIQVISSALN